MVVPYDFSKIRKARNKRLNLRAGFDDPLTWLDTGNYALNKRISGDFQRGVPLGAVTVFAGESGCLPASAKVTIQIATSVRVATIAELRLLFFLDQPVAVATPDGFQQVVAWFDKGELPMVQVTMANGLRTRCAFNHMLQRDTGEWLPASLLATGIALLTEQGISLVTTMEGMASEVCYDFALAHPHRYWGDGICSHNSGKSYIVSGNLVRDALAQGCHVILMDSEDALRKKWMHNLQIDTDHPNLTKEVASTVNEIADCIKEYSESYVELYKNTPRAEQPKLLFVVDSLGAVQTEAEIEQFNRSDLKGDKGIKAKMLKMLVANCIRLFAGFEIGLVATNHTYKSQDMYSPEDNISGGCLKPGMKVWLADGTMRNIEDVEIGNMVTTMFGEQPITRLWQYEKPTFRLELSDGQIVECTPEHQFLVCSSAGQKWKSASLIVEGDEIFAIGNEVTMRLY
jgi:hypothetical protein